MELNEEAWGLWVAHRKLIKHPIKNEEPAKMKLMRIGDAAAQMEAVIHSAGNGWQGLFAPEAKKADPHAPKERTSKEKDADSQRFAYANRQNEKGWEHEIKSITGRLHLAEALLARYDVLDDGSTVWTEKRDWLREQIAGLLRLADAQAVLQDLTSKRLVLRMYSDAGLRRLEQRAKVAA